MAVIQNNYTNYVTGTEMNDQIYNYVPAYIHGLGGNDEITNAAQIAFINGDAGNDVIVSYVSNSQVYLEGGTGNDYVLNYGQGVATIYGGYDPYNYDYDSDTLVGSPYAVDTFLVGEYCGYDVIQNYDFNDVIFCATTSGYPPTPYAQGNDIIITGDAMYVLVQGAAGKPLNFAYLPSYGGMTFDTAQDGASNLWGMQSFVATAATDNIFVSQSDGSDMIFGAAQDDVIHLYDATLSDIVSTSADENSVTINFSTGATAIVETADNISPTFKLASGESYVYNRTTNSWQEA